MRTRDALLWGLSCLGFGVATLWITLSEHAPAAEADLRHASGRVASVQSNRHGASFRLEPDARVYRYDESSGDYTRVRQGLVEAAQSGSIARVAFDPETVPLDVRGVDIEGRVRREPRETLAAWEREMLMGYAFAAAFLAGAAFFLWRLAAPSRPGGRRR